MDDLISRRELLESIEKVSVKGNVLDDDWVYRFVQEFPSIDAVPQWIPCEERLPKHGEYVFVYLFGDNPYIAWYNEPIKRWDTEEFEIDENEEPVAWMPLPKPYEAEGKEE